jgi:hypothetical protein
MVAEEMHDVVEITSVDAVQKCPKQTDTGFVTCLHVATSKSNPFDHTFIGPALRLAAGVESTA